MCVCVDDAHLARLKAPTGDQAEKAGEKAAYEARLNVDEAVCHTLLLFLSHGVRR